MRKWLTASQCATVLGEGTLSWCVNRESPAILALQDAEMIR
jgi:hypothetical protein